MTLEIIDVEQGTEPWLAARRGLVTASVIGKLITPKTVRPAQNDTARGLVTELVAERITGVSEETYVNADMERGIFSEPIARALYEEHFAPVAEVGFMIRTFDNGNRLGYSPDGLVGDDGLIEIKAPRQHHHLRTILADDVPLWNTAQCQAALLTTGRSWLDFISFCGGLPFYVKRVYPDPKWFAAIEEALAHFEQKAAETITAYETATAHLHPTERHTFDDIEIEV